MSMGAGTIADIFESGERGRAFAYYTCGPLLGPALGPIIGGYLNEGLGWRSNFWFLAIFCFMTWLGIVFFLPETWRAPITSDSDITLHEKPASLDSSSTLNQDTVSVKKPPPVEKKKKIVNPIGALKLFLFPNIALAVSFVGVL